MWRRESHGHLREKINLLDHYIKEMENKNGRFFRGKKIFTIFLVHRFPEGNL